MPPTVTSSTLAAAEMPTDPKGPTGHLACWLAGLQLADVPASAQRRAKDLILDGIACAIVGARLPWSRIAVDAVCEFEGRGNATIIGWSRSISGPAAALLNGTFIQGFELDDFHPYAPLHSASLVLPALWAAVEHGAARVSGADFLRAAIAGFEVGPRVGKALHGTEMLSRGWHSGSVFGTHAAASATARLLNLDAARIEDALGLAGTQSAGLMAAQYEAMCKRMHHGFASRNGYYAAMLAAHGYTGIKRVFERDYGGFLSTFGEGHNPDASQIIEALGERWETERIVIKPYAAMGGIHCPLDALFDADAKRRLVPAEIAQIDCYVSHALFHHGHWKPERPLTPIGAQMNIGYALAVGLLDRAALVKQFSPSRINCDDVWDMLARIRVHHEPAFDDSDPAERLRTRLVVAFTDGQRIDITRRASRALEEPQSSREVVGKYRALTDGLISAQRQDAIEHAVNDIESLDDVRDLIALLAPPVNAAFD